eukprot:457515-Rhodomonas_salina.2
MPTLWVGMSCATNRIQTSLSYQVNPRARWVATLWVAIRVAQPLWGCAFNHSPSPQLLIHPSLSGYLKASRDAQLPYWHLQSPSAVSSGQGKMI